MCAKRIITTSSSLYLTPELPVFVNRVSESFRLEQHKHEFVEINYVSEGSGYQYIEGQTIPVMKGDLFYLPLGVSHVFRPSTPMPERGSLIVYNCLIDQSYAAKLANAFPLDSDIRRLLNASYPEQPWLHRRDRRGLLQRAFNTMLEEYLRQELNFAAIVQAEIIRVLVHMNRMQPVHQQDRIAPSFNPLQMNPEHRGQDHTDASIDACTERIRNQPEGKLHISTLAVEAGLSERQFRRRFEERTGMTFTEFVHKCRIEASCELLHATTDKVAAIAQQVGYQDIKFFNRLFKKKTGMTPRQYRTNWT